MSSITSVMVFWCCYWHPISYKPQSNGNTTIGGNLDVGLGASVTSIKACVNHAGNQGIIKIEAKWRSQGFIHFNTDCADGLLLIAIEGDLYMYCGLSIYIYIYICIYILSYKPTTNVSDDRLKENKELV